MQYRRRRAYPPLQRADIFKAIFSLELILFPAVAIQRETFQTIEHKLTHEINADGQGGRK